MNRTATIKEKIIQITFLVIPILVTQIGLFSMNLFNTIMSGNFHPADLAGVAIGVSIWNPVFIGLSGILLAVSPIVAQNIGKGDHKEVASAVVHGVYLALMISSIVILAGFIFLKPLIGMMDLENRVAYISFHFLTGLAIGIVPLFLFNALRSFLYGLGKTRVVMFILLAALPVNLFFNYVLIFGKWGFPQMGGAGGGYATAITYWFIFALTVFIIKIEKQFSRYCRLRDFKQFSFSKTKEILKIGVPMGLSMFFETSMFALVTILISRYPVATIAAYQSALNVVALIYMIPLSMAQALTVLVGFEVGARRNKDARQYSWLGIQLATVVALVTSILVFLFRDQIAALYSNETEVIKLTSHFLIYAIIFHISDAIQVTAQAALRGYKDVNYAFIMTLIAYWGICLPSGYILSHYTNLGVYGYWIGLTMGLLSAGVALSIRLVYIQKEKFAVSKVFSQ